ncbi:hypothetical protein FRC05_004204 [Tulasnella sp. 425]|nr:hypothetical protein FRC05_004204 [Tulasnella sp. 425]
MRISIVAFLAVAVAVVSATPIPEDVSVRSTEDTAKRDPCFGTGCGYGWRAARSTEDTAKRSTNDEAKQKDRQDDEKWITNYAASCMSGRALRWHISLEKDVKTSWDALQKAMIAQWPAEQLKALPLENHNLKREGIIKVVRQSKELGYLGRHASGNTLGIAISPIAEEAMRVLHRPSHSLAEFELLGSSNELAFLGGTMMDAPTNIQLKTCINTASGNIYLVDQDEPAKKATAEEAYSDVPSLSPFVIGPYGAPHTLEFFYDIVCPFSRKSYANLRSVLEPQFVNDKYKDKLKIIIRLQPQPWHVASHFCHEAVLAVARVAPDQLLNYLDVLYPVNETFYDIPASTLTPVQIREKLAGIAEPVIGSEKLAAVNELLKHKSTPNGGVGVTEELKYSIKISRQNSIHTSPTVLWDGLVQEQVSSSWGEKEWTDFFNAKV